MPARVLDSSSASPARTFSSTFPRFKRKGISRETKAKRLSSKLPGAPKACRLRTSPASSQEERAGKPGSLFFFARTRLFGLWSPVESTPPRTVHQALPVLFGRDYGIRSRPHFD